MSRYHKPKPKPLPTKERLALALQALDEPGLQPVIERARQGLYDDFESPYPLPQHQLVADLAPYNLPAFVERVKNGEFDATREEGEAWYRKEGRSLLEMETWLNKYFSKFPKQ